MEIKFLEVLVMDNGEILCEGKQVGFVKKLGKYLFDRRANYSDKDDMEMLERENQAMANALLQLGYTDEQISDIANGAI